MYVVAVAEPPRHRRTKGNDAAGSLEISLQRQHETMAVDDAGRRRRQSGHCLELRLERVHLVGGEPGEVGYAVRDGHALDGLERRDLSLVRRHDQLAAATVLDAARLAEFIEEPVAGHAKARFG